MAVPSPSLWESDSPMANPTARPLVKRVLLMGTCLCDAFYDDVARATVEVLEHLGLSVEYPDAQTCCGQPAFNSGDWSASRKVARHCAEVFAGDLPVIVPSGSSAAMNRHGNLLQFEDNPDPAIQSHAGRTWEVIDFIFTSMGIKTWPGKFDQPTRLAKPMQQISHIAIGQRHRLRVHIQDRHPQRAHRLAIGQHDPPSAARSLRHQHPLLLQKPQRRFHRVTADPQFDRQTRAPSSTARRDPPGIRPQVFPHLLGGGQHAQRSHAR